VQCPSRAVHDDYCSRCLSSLTMPPSVVLLDSSWRIFLDSFENYLLIGCVHHANTHQDDQPVMNLPPVETILFKYMLSPVFTETIQSSRHASHSLQYKGSWLYAQCYSPWIPLSFVKSDHERKCVGIINDVHHPYSCGEVCIWASKQMVPQSVLVGASFWHSF
jgi:hypothetical protein